jgi:uncharacterized protein YbaR (Trm112 family)
MQEFEKVTVEQEVTQRTGNLLDELEDLFEQPANDVRTIRCNRCKEFYSISEGLPTGYCPKCTELKEAQTQLIRDLIRENKGINAIQLERQTGIPISFIMNVMKEGEIGIRKPLF